MTANINKIKENIDLYKIQTFDVFEVWSNTLYLIKQAIELDEEDKKLISGRMDYNARTIVEDMRENENILQKIVKKHLNEDFKYRLNGTIDVFYKLILLLEQHKTSFSYTREYNWPPFSGCEMPINF